MELAIIISDNVRTNIAGFEIENPIMLEEFVWLINCFAIKYSNAHSIKKNIRLLKSIVSLPVTSLLLYTYSSKNKENDIKANS
jgi:hypothetical protein